MSELKIGLQKLQVPVPVQENRKFAHILVVEINLESRV